jgi:sodium/proline symporter
VFSLIGKGPSAGMQTRFDLAEQEFKAATR